MKSCRKYFLGNLLMIVMFLGILLLKGPYVLTFAGYEIVINRDINVKKASAANCPVEILEVTGVVEINASDYAVDNYEIDCSAESLVIKNGGTLRIIPDITDDALDSNDHGLSILANNFDIETGGLLDLEGYGYGAGQQLAHVGSGKSSFDTCEGDLCGGSGGGHGGSGGRGDPGQEHTAGNAGASYGVEDSPVTLGSGGGESSTQASGGAGGGSVKLVVNGTFTLNGMIVAGGDDGIVSGDTTGGGGGAGGGVLIDAGAFGGSGSVSADGGNGGSGTIRHGGGGGGGRVAMTCTTANSFGGTATVSGGAGGVQDGQVGTLVGPSCYPNNPAELKQYDDQDVLIEDNGSTQRVSMRMEFLVSDIEAQSNMIPQVEVRLASVPFTGVATHTGSTVAYAGTPLAASVNVYGLIQTSEYHWQARVVDGHGLESEWVEFEEGDFEEIDFVVLGNPALMLKISGDSQSGTVGTVLSSPFVIEIQDAGGHVIPDVSVTWEVKQGGGSVSDDPTVTDVNGRTETTLTLGTVSGADNNKVDAIRTGASGSPMSFTASANPDILDYYYVDVPAVVLIDTDFTTSIEARDSYENIITSANHQVTLSDVLPTEDCTGADGPGVLDILNTTLSSGTATINNQQYDTAEAIEIKVTGEGSTGCSDVVNIVTEFGNCFGVVNNPANSPLIITENQSFTASQSNGGVINCSEIDLTFSAGVTVTLESDYGNNIGVTLIAKGLDIAGTAVVTADGKGYGQGGHGTYLGPGGGSMDGQEGGGYGGYGQSNEVGVIYGSVYEPVDLGSAGGGNDYWGNIGHGGPGGGAIKLDITNTLTVDGEITSKGGKPWGYGGAAGSGGSIWIDTGTIAGGGLIKANGETLHDGGGDASDGSGGRISVYYSTNSGFNLDMDHIQTYGTNGGPGTIYIEHKGVDPVHGAELYADNNDVNGRQAGLVEGNYQFNKVELTRYGHIDVLGEGSVLTITDGSALSGDVSVPDLTVYGTLNYTGAGTFYVNEVDVGIHGEILGVTDFTVGNLAPGGVTLYAHNWAYSGSYTFGDVVIGVAGTFTLVSYDDNDGEWNNDYGVMIAMDNFTVETGGVVDSTGYQGYNGDGAGGPFEGSCAARSGGAYGGYAQDNSCQVPYGDVYEPVDLGSGGRGVEHYGWRGGGGYGGGAVRLNISDTLVVDGTLGSNGSDGFYAWPYYGGGGAGGSMWIETDTIEGSGYITANGGVKGDDESTGNGSGGRIAIYYGVNNGFILDVDHIQSRGRNGGPGTIYIEHVGVDPVHGAELYVDNNDVDSRQAGLVEGSYQFNKVELTRYGYLDILGMGSVLTITDGSALSGDVTVPDLTVYGTLNYTGAGIFYVNEVDVGIHGEISGVTDFTVGNLAPGGLTLYANTWAHNENSQYSFGDGVIDSNGMFTLIGYDDNDGEWDDDYGVVIDMDNFTVETGGLVDSTGYQGYNGDGAGGPFDGSCTQRSGGAYGGYAQDNGCQIPYGDVYEPVDLGSGGRGREWYGWRGGGGYGGGAVRLNISDTLVVDGTLGSNGSDGYADSWGGGGSGGSIWIDTDTIEGSGYITANGGTKGDDESTGNGSGGRIALYYGVNNGFSLDVDHIQSRGRNGGPGTVYIEHVGYDLQKGGLLYVDNDDIDTLHAGMSRCGNSMYSTQTECESHGRNWEDSYQFNKVELTGYGHLDMLGEGTGCSDSQYESKSECEDNGEVWDGGILLTVTSGAGLDGDDTMPGLTIWGTLNGPSNVSINGIDVGIKGEITGMSNISLGVSGVTKPGGLTLYANTWAHNEDSQYTFGDMMVGDDGTFTLVSYDDNDGEWDDDYGVVVDMDNFTVETGGLVDSTGYQGYNGDGAGGPFDGSCAARSGGAYGGYAQDNSCQVPYGDVYEPVDLGSGGRGVEHYGWRGGGGYGGGAVRLNISDTLVVDGTLESNGSDGFYAWPYYGGGGSGGSMWIDTDTIEGSGYITANGGVKGNDESTGNGSGGRIALYYGVNNGFSLDVEHIQSRGRNGGPGTIYIENVGVHRQLGGSLFIDNDSHSGLNSADVAPSDYIFHDIFIGENVRVKILGDTTEDQGVKFDLTGNFTMETGSYIDGDEEGFVSGEGPGAGVDGIDEGGGGTGGGGGAHGGSGGIGEGDGVTGETQGGGSYGSAIYPVTLGSGGGASGSGSAGGVGGGALVIDLDGGTVLIDGTISVDGGGGLTSSPGGGGGAGGSIYIGGCDITVGATGVLSASGGDGGDDPLVDGGGGGGGIIALGYTCSLTMDPLATIDDSEGSGYQAGGEGVYGEYSEPKVFYENQYDIDNGEVALGAVVDKRAVKFKINVTDPDTSDLLTPQIEFDLANEDNTFDNTNIIEGDPVEWAGGLVPIELEIVVERNGVGGLLNGADGTHGTTNRTSSVLGITSDGLDYGSVYKWRGRVVDQEGVPSDWVDFGDNGDNTDFGVASDTCGNNVIDTGEDCDGSDLDGATCETRGYDYGNLTCSIACSYDESGCGNISCGNGILEAANGEQCDTDDLGDFECSDFGNFTGGTLSCDSLCEFDTSGCTLPSTCGDGIVDLGEQCDGGVGDMTCESFGYDGGQLFCGSDCMYDVSGCRTDAGDGVCGDGVLNTGEQCDGDVGEMTCTDFADFTGGNLVCTDECLYDTSGCTVGGPVCGDGNVDPGEQCDGDAGDLTCADFDGYIGGVLVCGNDCQYDLSDCIVDDGYMDLLWGVTGLLPFSLWLASLTSMSSLTVGDLLANIVRFMQWLLRVVGLKRKQKKPAPWGYVYDAVKKAPVRRAIVRVLKGGKLIDTVVTDLYGVFQSTQEEGVYHIEVRKVGFMFPSLLIKGKVDGVIQNVYRGENYQISADKKMVSVSIPLDPREYSGMSRKLRKIWSTFVNILVVINPYVLMAAAAVSAVQFVRYGQRLDLGLLILNVVMLMLFIYGRIQEKARWGVVVDESGDRLEGVSVGLYDTKYGRLVDSRVTDSKGRYQFVLPGDIYWLRPTGRDYVLVDPKLGKGYVVGKKKDTDIIISQKVVVRRARG